MSFAPQAMCARCQQVFPAEATPGEELRCPACGHLGPPERLMRVSGPPSLDAFVRNWRKAHGDPRASGEKER